MPAFLGPALGFLGGAAIQSTIFAVINALLQKGGRTALGALGKQGLSKIPGLGKFGAAGPRAASGAAPGLGMESIVNTLRPHAESGATLGVGLAGFDLLADRLGAAGGAPTSPTYGFSMPTMQAGTDDGSMDLQNILELLLAQSQGTGRGQQTPPGLFGI